MGSVVDPSVFSANSDVIKRIGSIERTAPADVRKSKRTATALQNAHFWREEAQWALDNWGSFPADIKSRLVKVAYGIADGHTAPGRFKALWLTIRHIGILYELVTNSEFGPAVIEATRARDEFADAVLHMVELDQANYAAEMERVILEARGSVTEMTFTSRQDVDNYVDRLLED